MIAKILSLAILFLCAEAYLLGNVFPALLAFLVSFYLGYSSLELRPRISAERFVDGRLYEGLKAKVKLLLKNPSRKYYWVELVEEPDFKERKLEILVEPGEKEVEYSIKPSKGFYEVKGFLRIFDSRKLFFENLKLDEMRMEVLPSVESLKEGARIRASGGVTKAIFGSPVDFHSLREFQAGDDSRRIDWKASARLGELIVKEFVKEWEGDIYLVFDASREMRKKLDFSLSLAYKILDALRGKKVGLVIYDELGVKKVVRAGEPLNLVKELKLSPLRGMLSTKVGIRFSSTLRRLLRRIPARPLDMLKKIPMKSLLIFLTDLSNPDELFRVLIELRKECRVVVISPNPVLFYEGKLDMDELLKLYKAYIEREELLRKLGRFVPVVDVGKGDELLEVIA